MSQSGYTPIYIYNSGTATNVPTSGNLGNGELAINYADGKLFYKDSGGNVQVIASKAGNVNVSSFSAGTTGFTPNTATTGAVTLSGTLVTTNGGTGLSTYAAGDLPYYASGTALSKLGIGSSGQILTSTGSAPQWSTLSSVAVTTFSAGTTGFTPSTATSGAITLAGTLATTNGGTGLISFTANGVVYASSTSALATGSALTFDGVNVQNSANFISGRSGGNDGSFVLKRSSDGLTVGSFSVDSANSLVNFYTAYDRFSWTNYAGEQMRLTSTGLGIGTSSPSYPLSVVGSAGGYAASIGGATYAFKIYTDTAQVQINDGGAEFIQFVPGSNFISFGTNNAEKMRIDSSGNLLVGVSSYNAAVNSNYFLYGSGLVSVGHVSGTSSGSAFQQFVYNATQIGSITQSGTTAVAYNTSSDQRLKTDLGQVTSTNVIDNTIVHDFVWKTDGTQARGVFAQEAHKVIPQAVKVGDDGEEVEDAWGVDYSKYVPDLIVYCQQLKVEIQSLKAEVATLKGA